ncbi:MAG: hypothetical protein ACUVTR_00430 [Dehalococcoidia bacterium]
MLRILQHDRIATLKNFLTRIPGANVREVCIDMTESLPSLVEALYPGVKEWQTTSM